MKVAGVSPGALGRQSEPFEYRRSIIHGVATASNWGLVGSQDTTRQ